MESALLVLLRYLIKIMSTTKVIHIAVTTVTSNACIPDPRGGDKRRREGEEEKKMQHIEGNILILHQMMCLFNILN